MTALLPAPAPAEVAESPVRRPVDPPTTHAIQARPQGNRWKRSYRRRLVVVDAIVVVAAVILALIAPYGVPASESWGVTVGCAVALIVVWVTALGFGQSRDLSLAGFGAEEYRRVVTSTASVFGVLAAGGLVLHSQIARGHLLIALPIGLAGLLIGRCLLRRYLAKKRSHGAFTNNVVVLGKPDSIVALCNSFGRSKSAGYNVIGACVLDLDREVGDVLETSAGQVPIVGDASSVEEALLLTGADALAVAAVERLGQEQVRTLAWRLDKLRVDMIVAPGMADVAGPRLKARPIDNVPLFHIARAEHDSAQSKFGKRLFDLAFASVALVLLIPVFLAVAVAIKVDDSGPVFFRQQRPGLRGRPFRILKFRTMSVDAEASTDAERPPVEPVAEIFFCKSESDRRVTRVGRFLRKTSLDEIPQLFNVLAGAMSIVGPRPLIPGEGLSVEYYTERRGLVKPGITGLWQISGRSSVSAEERVQLDHSYVDNWSLRGDMVIVLRTVRAVLTGRGAY